MRTKINQLKKQLKNERGLTLVELLAVIVILAIIAVIAFVMIGNVTENSKKDAHISNAQQLIAAAKLYDATEDPIPAEGITGSDLNAAGYLDVLINPWTKKSEDYEGTVTKDEIDEENKDKQIMYYVKMEGTEKGDCDFPATSEAELAEKGRDICDDEG